MANKKGTIFVDPHTKQTETSMPKVLHTVPEIDSEHADIPVTTSKEKENIEENSQKFEKLVSKSDRILFKTKTVFPFDLFPDTVCIDEAKINIIHRTFFFTSDIQSIPVQHIQDVEVDTSVFFATLKILPFGFSENWISVEYLWKRDGIRARRIIAGLLMGIKEGIDFSKVETPNFIEKIEELGKVS